MPRAFSSERAFLEDQRCENRSLVMTKLDHERNVNLSVQWNRWLLIPIGAWPSSRETIIRKYISRLINIICFALIVFMFVSCGLFLIVEVEQAYNQIRMIGPLSFFVMTFMKYYLLILHKDDIREGIERIEWDWKNIEHQEDKNIMTEHATYGRKIVAVCTFFVYSAFAFYYIAVPVSVGKVVAEGGNFSYTPLPFPASRLIADVYRSPSNEIVHSIQVLTGMVMHAVTSAACSIAAVFAVHACGQMQVLINWLGYLVDGRSDMSNTVEGRMATIVSQHDRILLDVRFSPVNEIVFALQFLSGFIVTSVTVGACGLAAVLAMHACGQLNVVMARLDELVDTRDEEKPEGRQVAQRKLGSIVEHHLRTLSLMEYIEKVMNKICLVELVGCTMNMCMLKYYLLTEKSKEVLVAYAIVYVSMVFNIFIFCYIGEIIQEQGNRIGEKVYMTEWYRLPHKISLGLVMIISRSNMVVKITAGKFIQISIATFGTVFKTSFAYFNMIRTIAM